jgi:acyl-CoA thioesterase FadM
MNNAAFLSHAEYARTQMCAENGILEACIRYKAGFVITSSTLRFRQQLGPFGQAFQVETSLVGLDERNAWLLQNFRKTKHKNKDGGQQQQQLQQRCLSQVLVQTSLVERGKVVDPRSWLVEKAHIHANVVDSVNLPLVKDDDDNNSDDHDDETHVAMMQAILDRSNDLAAALRRAIAIDDAKSTKAKTSS